jgi:hypothetical protein
VFLLNLHKTHFGFFVNLIKTDCNFFKLKTAQISKLGNVVFYTKIFAQKWYFVIKYNKEIL